MSAPNGVSEYGSSLPVILFDIHVIFNVDDLGKLGKLCRQQNDLTSRISDEKRASAKVQRNSLKIQVHRRKKKVRKCKKEALQN